MWMCDREKGTEKSRALPPNKTFVSSEHQRSSALSWLLQIVRRSLAIGLKCIKTEWHIWHIIQNERPLYNNDIDIFIYWTLCVVVSCLERLLLKSSRVSQRRRKTKPFLAVRVNTTYLSTRGRCELSYYHTKHDFSFPNIPQDTFSR